jgi:hypothetical protein
LSAIHGSSHVDSGTLETLSFPPHGIGSEQVYESNIDTSSGEFFFLPQSGTPGLFSFDGKWLAFNGSTSGFTICEPENAIENPVVCRVYDRSSFR